MTKSKKTYQQREYSKDPTEQAMLVNAIKATRVVLKNGINHECTPYQWRIYRDSCRNCNLEDYDHDVQDCISVALLSLEQSRTDKARQSTIKDKVFEVNPDISDEDYQSEYEHQVFLQACRDINNYLYSMRSIKLNATQMKTCYIEDDCVNEDGEVTIVNVNNEINNLITELSVPAMLSPIERKVLKLWAEGYSIAESGEKLHLKVKYETINGKIKATCKSVEYHRANIKNKLAPLLENK